MRAASRCPVACGPGGSAPIPAATRARSNACWLAAAGSRCAIGALLRNTASNERPRSLGDTASPTCQRARCQRTTGTGGSGSSSADDRAQPPRVRAPRCSARRAVPVDAEMASRLRGAESVEHRLSHTQVRGRIPRGPRPPGSRRGTVAACRRRARRRVSPRPRPRCRDRRARRRRAGRRRDRRGRPRRRANDCRALRRRRVAGRRRAPRRSSPRLARGRLRHLPRACCDPPRPPRRVGGSRLPE